MRNRGSSVIIENNKVALIKRVRDGNQYYVFPGGGIENEESPEEATIRETLEELGVHISIKERLGIVKHTGIQYFFIAEVIEGTFGTGGGEEFSGDFRNRGTYKPMWIELEHLLSLNVYPIEIAEKVYSLYRP
ncbi:NUDIX domain-containing protein [Sporosarcina sp. ANT_H38]|uniref:NUDIX domain-containing protein n=1 Tax=Sporosarcina sp. ANT_H38 TaxID=2597358 RepID=UPI0011F272CC|nr:NUDIX domain-containing protein [Sporosarcina sp. ANT_H38]KAA0948533.1 NUDIX domain-containing protein [Sporosarcina sp. ANT_H38]